MNSINFNNFKNLGSNPFRIREKRDLQDYYNKRWGKNTLSTPSNVSILKTTQTNKAIQEAIGNEFSKRKSLTQSELRIEPSSTGSISLDDGIFEIDDIDAKFDYKRDRDNELVTLYQNRECEVSNSQQDEIVCLRKQGHDSHNINSAMSNLDECNFRKAAHPNNENKSPDNVMAIVDIEFEYPLATIGRSRKKQSPVNDITSARPCASPPIIIDQTALRQPNSEPIQIKKRAKSMDDNISDFIDNLNLSIGSKMHLQRLVSEFQKKEPVKWEFFLTSIKNKKNLNIDF